MANFYREFTKDLQRRFNSRAFDLKPQDVVSNDVQMILKVDEPFVKKVVIGWRQVGLSHTTATTDYIYGQTLIALDDSVITPLTNGFSVGTIGVLNPPFFIASRDEIDTLTIDQISFSVEASNATGLVTSTSHSVIFGVQTFGQLIDFNNCDFVLSTSGTIPAASSRSLRNIFGPYNTNASANISNRIQPIVFNRERLVSQTGSAPDPDTILDQITWFARHQYGAGETQTTSFSLYVKCHCTITFQTPFGVLTRSQLGTVQP